MVYRYLLFLIVSLISIQIGFSQKKGQIHFDFNVLNYGAIPQKHVNSTLAFQAAIDSCSQKGGGKVVVPNGEYSISTIRLKSNIDFIIENGAHIFALNDPSLYQNNKKNSEKANEIDIPVLILGQNLENISITGGGKIIGEPSFEWFDAVADEEWPGWNRNAQVSGVNMKAIKVATPKISLIYISDCKNVNISNISILNSPNWSCHFQWCLDVKIQGVKISSNLEKGVNSNGLDIDGCKNVLISDCVIATGDDAICLKTSRHNGRSESCEDIVINNCITSSSSCALKLGTESYSDFRRILFSNCIVKNSNRGLGIIIRDGGHASDVVFENIIIECKRRPFFWWGDGDAFQFVVLKRNSNSKVGSIKNLKVRNITAKTEGTSIIKGFEKQNIENVELSNVELILSSESEIDKRTNYGIIAENAKELTMNNLKIVFADTLGEKRWKSPLLLKNVNEIMVNQITGKLANINRDFPIIDMLDVTNAWVFNSVAMPGTKSFCRIDGAKTADIQFINNSLKNTQQPVIISPVVKQKVWMDKLIITRNLEK